MICPFCRNEEEHTSKCSKCGTDLETYEQRKQEQLARVCDLLNENRFVEAREIAQTLPAEFPDNRTEFVLLLSNITRDISIVEKCDQAVKAMAVEDYAKASLLLRNIQAFDKNLNERVISLRRRAEQHVQNSDKLWQAITHFDNRQYGAAYHLFTEIKGADCREETATFLLRLGEIRKDLLEEAAASMRENRFDIAVRKLDFLEKEFPDTRSEVQGYRTLIDKRNELKDNILQAAKAAARENRMLDAKIAYTLLGIQFPEYRHQIRRFMQETGHAAALSMAELHEKQDIDLTMLTNRAGSAVNRDDGLRRWSMPDIAPADLTGDALSEVAPVQGSQQGTADSVGGLLQIEIEQIADFIF